MIEKLYEKICKGEDRRASLSALKAEVKERTGKKRLLAAAGNNLDEIMKCLVDEDAKVRKNAAAVLGVMNWQPALDVLFDAYEEEEQLFVKAEYVRAMAALDCGEYLPELHERLEKLLSYHAPENEKKHVQAEINALQKLFVQKEGIRKHTFTGYHRANEILLLTLPVFRDALAAKITGKKALLKSGVRTVTADMENICSIRIFSEMLFVLKCDRNLSADPEELADALKKSDLMQILTENHREKAPFYFRIGISGSMPLEERSSLSKKLAAAIETKFSRELINSTSGYEMEIRLIPGAKGGMVPFLKLYTIPDHRFDYRKYHVSASMRPFLAAGLLELAKPYLKQHAQVLDPFCGVGTCLIERKFLMPARSCYGIDTFGEAIEKARANSKIAGMPINYINKNFFTFEHDYLFDEIITDMPMGNLSRQEQDMLYQRFFEKASEVLAEGGKIICYSREMGLIKKQIRLHSEFRLLQEFCIQEKSGAYLFIIERK